MARRTTIEDLTASLGALEVTPSQWVWEPTAVLAAYRRALDPEQPTVVVDVGVDCTVVAACVGKEVSGLLVVGAATEPGFARDLGWAVRTLETTAERAVLGGHLYESAAETVAATLDGVRVETLPQDCPVALADRAQSAWRTLTAVVGLTLVAGGDAEPPVLSFATSGEAVPSAGNERREILRRLGPWAGAAILLLAIAAGIDAARLVRDVGRLEKAAERIFSTAMPGVPGGAGQRMKLDLKLAELERRQTELAGGVQADSALGILVSMSEAVPADLEVEFESYAYDPPNVRLRGQGDSFESVTRLQQLLRESTPYKNVDVGDVRSAASGEGVQFELTIRLGERASTRMNEWWQRVSRAAVAGLARLSPREQRLIGAFLALLTAAALYLGVVEPLLQGRTHLEQRIVTLSDDIVAMRVSGARVADLERSLGRLENNRKLTKDFSLFSFVDKSASTTVTPGAIAAMNPSRRRVRDGEEESLVEVRLSSVPLTEVVGFLRKIEQATEPVYVKRVDMKRRYDDKTHFDATIVAAMIEKP